MKYELFYPTGGHGGPYHSLNEAVVAARRLLRGFITGTITYIDIRLRTKDGFGDVVQRVTLDEANAEGSEA